MNYKHISYSMIISRTPVSFLKPKFLAFQLATNPSPILFGRLRNSVMIRWLWWKGDPVQTHFLPQIPERDKDIIIIIVIRNLRTHLLTFERVPDTNPNTYLNVWNGTGHQPKHISRHLKVLKPYRTPTQTPTSTLETVPETGLATIISIFMAESMQRVSPAATRLPGATLTSKTLADIGAPTWN